jgi:hypothetical protein
MIGRTMSSNISAGATPARGEAAAAFAGIVLPTITLILGTPIGGKR